METSYKLAMIFFSQNSYRNFGGVVIFQIPLVSLNVLWTVAYKAYIWTDKQKNLSDIHLTQVIMTMMMNASPSAIAPLKWTWYWIRKHNSPVNTFIYHCTPSIFRTYQFYSDSTFHWYVSIHMYDQNSGI